MAIVLISAIIDFVGEGFHKALHHSGDAEGVLEVARHIADANFDRAELMVRADIPPDLADSVDEAGVDHVVDEPHVFAPIAHERGQAGGGEAFHHFRAVRLQTGAASFPEGTADT